MLNTDRVPRHTVLLYGLPGLPLAVLGIPLYVFLPPFYAETVGIATVGLVLLVARLWDVLTDPLVGALGDRLNIGPGRRKSLILVGTPLLLLAVEQLFRPPDEAGMSHLLVWSFLVYLAWTLVALPYTAWGAELSRDYDQRASITGTREGFVIAGMLLAIALPATMVPDGSADASLAWLSGMLWVTIPLGLGLALLLVPEPRNVLPPVPWREGLRLLEENRPFFRLLTAYLLNGLANALPATLFLLFAQHVLVAEDAAGAMLITYFAAGLAGIPPWLWLARRIGKHRAWACSMLWAAAVFMWVPFLGEGDVRPFLLICLLSGLSLGIDIALPAAIQADLVDRDTAEGGGQRTGLYFGLWSMATKLALALAVGLAFPLLALAGFDATGLGHDHAHGHGHHAHEHGHDHGDGGLLALALLYGAAPVPFKLAAVWLMWRFPVDRRVLGDWQRRVRNLEANAGKS